MTASKVTITDIARRCGVSVQTVSRVVNDRRDVSPSTREAVQTAIAESGYQPSAVARGLVQQRSSVLGAVVGRLLYPSVCEILDGVAQECQERGYGLLLSEVVDVTSFDPVLVVRRLAAHQVAGLVFIAPPSGWDVDLSSLLSPAGLPAVLVPGEIGPGDLSLTRIGRIVVSKLLDRSSAAVGTYTYGEVSG
jgi:LacI family transcriptional regulator